MLFEVMEVGPQLGYSKSEDDARNMIGIGKGAAHRDMSAARLFARWHSEV